MLDYRNKIICAPMVRIGNLPFRLLCLRYGADIVYTDEIIDYKLVRCERFVNDALGTIDYISDEDHVVFRTCKEEKDKLVLQVGTNCPDRALKAAKLVEQDISGFDINMGCPKTFSVKGGMGSALLDEPETIRKILTNLVQNLSIPVTCKIRVLPSLEDTIELCKMIESTGVAAIAIHGRTRPERPHNTNRTDYIRKITEVLKIPVIANGESENIKTYDDIIEFRKKANASSVMLARAARDNCSIFRKAGKLDRNTVINEYLDLCMKYELYFSIAKFTLQCMMGFVHESTGNAQFHSSSSMRELCKVFHKEDDYDRIAAELKTKNSELLKRFTDANDQVNQQNNGQTNGSNAQINNGGPDETLNGGKELSSRYNPLSRKRKLIELIKNEVDADEIASLQFVKAHFSADSQLPKNVLHKWSTQNQKRITYRTMPAEKRFYCVCECDGTKYMSSHLEKNKKLAEQASALVACARLNLIDKELVAKCEVDKLLIDPTIH